MGAAIGTIPYFSTYQPGALPIASTVYIEIVDSLSATSAQSWNQSQIDFVGKAPAIIPNANPVANDRFAFYQASSGLPKACTLGNFGVPFGNVPTGGVAGQMLVKLSGTNFDAGWSSIIQGPFGVVGTTNITGLFGVQGRAVFTSGATSTTSLVDFGLFEFNAGPDNSDVTVPGTNAGGLNVRYTPGPLGKGQKAAIRGLLIIPPATPSNTLGDYIGVAGVSFVESSNGAAPTSYGVEAQGWISTNATGFLVCSGGEAVANILPGADAQHRWGWSIPSGGSNKGVVTDAALSIAATGLAWTHGVLFTNTNGAAPVDGTLIGTDGVANTVVNGIDISAYTYTGWELRTPHFTVHSNGSTIATGWFGSLGTAFFTATFKVLGTSTFTGVHGIVGTTLVTGTLGIVGTASFTGVHGIVGTTLVTGTFGVVGTATMTGAVAILGTTTIRGTDAGATGPNLTLFHDSASPAALDKVGVFQFNGNNSAAAQKQYAEISAEILSTTAGAEYGCIRGQVLSSSIMSDTALGTETFLLGYQSPAGSNFEYVFRGPATKTTFMYLEGFGGGATGPSYNIWHNSPSQAAADVPGAFVVDGNADNGTTYVHYSEINTIISNANTVAAGAAMQFRTVGSAVMSETFRIDDRNNLVIGTAAIASAATNGFLYLPTTNGTPTGTPTTYAGRAPMVIDTTNNRLYFYSSAAWRNAGP